MFPKVYEKCRDLLVKNNAVIDKGRASISEKESKMLASEIIPMDEILKRAEGEKYQVKLKKMPKGISQVRIYPAQIDFLIENVAKDDAD